MNEIKELFKQAFQEAKQDPVEAVGSLAVLLLIFGTFYCAMWIVCPC